jgi:hypothetical protein
VVAIAHNAKAYDLHFILNRAILLKWQPELIMNGKIMSMKVEHLHFLDSVSCLPTPLRKLPQAFGLSATIMVPSLQHQGKRITWDQFPTSVIMEPTP